MSTAWGSWVRANQDSGAERELCPHCSDKLIERETTGPRNCPSDCNLLMLQIFRLPLVDIPVGSKGKEKAEYLSLWVIVKK